ncbi:MAG: zf-HC2 domain-containing protein [Acidobacteria bacterium]|nr:zf-HC2 domain-containing protein [Acidobacteriota bacterium]
MSCAEFEEMIGDYLDHGLPSQVRRQCATHLLACSTCRGLSNDIRANIDALRRSRISNSSDQFIARTGGDLLFHPSANHLASGSGEIAWTESNLVSAPTIGEIVSCRTLDLVISDLFEASIEQDDADTPELEAVNAHLLACRECEGIFQGLRLASGRTTRYLHYCFCLDWSSRRRISTRL